MLVRMNHREFTTLSNSTRLSCIRFCTTHTVSDYAPAPNARARAPRTCVFSSYSIWSYSDSAAQKMIDVTFSKQWIHFLRSERCPPTSNMWILRARVSGPLGLRGGARADTLEVLHGKTRLGDPARRGAGAQDVVDARHVVGLADSWRVLKEAGTPSACMSTHTRAARTSWPSP
jgi:hypothetical protein